MSDLFAFSLGIGAALFGALWSLPASAAAPTVAISLDKYDISYGDTALVTFTFSTAPVGFTNADVILSSANGTLSTVTVTGNPAVYTATYTPGASVEDSTNIIGVGVGWTDGSAVPPDAATYMASTYAGTGILPEAIAYDGTNIWTANRGDNSVTKITPTGVMTTYTGTGSQPWAIAFDGTNMWTANNGDDSVTKVTPTGIMTTYSGTGSAPRGIAFDGTNMWTANYGTGGSGSGGVTKITPSGTMNSYNSASYGPISIIFDGTHLWVPQYNDISVAKITLTGTPLGSYGDTMGNPISIAHAGGNIYWIVNQGGSTSFCVDRFEVNTSWSTFCGSGSTPFGAAFDGTNLWTADQDGNSVIRITPAGAFSTYTGTGSQPMAIIYDGSSLWTANAGGYSVTKIDPYVAATSSNFTVNTIPPNVLTSTDMEPESLTAGSTGTATISFTNINPIPSNGKIKVTFPTISFSATEADMNYDLSAVTTATCSTMDGSFGVAVSGQVVTITRSGGTSEPAGAQTCTFGPVTNPHASGSTGTYGIKTTDASDVTIDEEDTVDADTITSEVFTSAYAAPFTTLVDDDQGGSSFEFTTVNPIPYGATLAMQFPIGYDVSDASVNIVSSYDGELTTSISGRTVTVGFLNDPVGHAPAGQYGFSVTGAKTPMEPGVTGGFYMLLKTAGDVMIGSAAVSGTEVFDRISATDIELETLLVGATGTATVDFTSAYQLDNYGSVNVTFPAGFDVRHAANATCSGIDGDFMTLISGQTVTIGWNNGGVISAAAGAKTCTIVGIKNPTVAGLAGDYEIDLYNHSDVHDTDSSVPGDVIVPAALTSTNVEPASLVAGATGTATVSFTTVNGIAANGKVKVTFPAGFDVSAASGATCSTTMNGSYLTSVSGQVVTITRRFGTRQTAAAEVCTIGGIKNPVAPGTTGVYGVAISDSSNGVTDEDAAVAADVITATPAIGTLSSVNVQPASLQTSTTGSVTVSFTTENAIPATGKVRVTFGSGFNLSGVSSASCSTMDGTFSKSVSGQTVTITRGGDGTSQTAAAETCIISGVKNPTSAGATGSYTVVTTDSSFVTIDSGTAASDNITAPSSGGGGGGGGGGGSSSNQNVTLPTYTVRLVSPNGGQSFLAGTIAMVTWDSNVAATATGRILLSQDGGTSFLTIAQLSSNAGVYAWTVPTSVTTRTARIKVQLYDGAALVAEDASGADFAISPSATVPPATGQVGDPDGDTEWTGAYSRSSARAATTSIDTDLGIGSPPAGRVVRCTAGSLIKTSVSTAVYYCGRDGRRYVFTSEAVFKSWFADFSSVVTISLDTMAAIPLGGNVTIRPGTKLVKIQTDPKVYALARGGTLRWVTTEALARAIYGLAWNREIVDIPDAFFTDYERGPDITAAD